MGYRRLAAWGAIAAGLMWFGCTMDMDDPEVGDLSNSEPGHTTQPIIGGYVDYGHPTTGVIYPSRCTANLIGDRTVLTACHCINYSGEPATFCAPRPGTATIPGYGSSDAPSEVDCVNGTAFPGPWCNPNEYEADHDLAYAVLSQNFRELYGVIPSRISSTTPVGNAPVTGVGFGCTEWDGPGYGTKRYGHSDIDSVKTWRITFDENSSYGGFMGCPGDSGGPVFGNGQSDCQIATFAGRGYVPFNYYTEGPRVDPWWSWIAANANDPSILRCDETRCGDDICHSQESCSSCPEDCGECPVADCGDGVCNGDETCSSCALDCGECCVPPARRCTDDYECCSMLCLDEGYCGHMEK